jgi:hypothetical protein
MFTDRLFDRIRYLHTSTCVHADARQQPSQQAEVRESRYQCPTLPCSTLTLKTRSLTRTIYTSALENYWTYGWKVTPSL